MQCILLVKLPDPHHLSIQLPNFDCLSCLFYWCDSFETLHGYQWHIVQSTVSISQSTKMKPEYPFVFLFTFYLFLFITIYFNLYKFCLPFWPGATDVAACVVRASWIVWICWLQADNILSSNLLNSSKHPHAPTCNVYEHSCILN